MATVLKQRYLVNFDLYLRQKKTKSQTAKFSCQFRFFFFSNTKRNCEPPLGWVGGGEGGQAIPPAFFGSSYRLPNQFFRVLSGSQLLIKMKHSLACTKLPNLVLDCLIVREIQQKQLFSTPTKWLPLCLCRELARYPSHLWTSENMRNVGQWCHSLSF